MRWLRLMRCFTMTAVFCLFLSRVVHSVFAVGRIFGYFPGLCIHNYRSVPVDVVSRRRDRRLGPACSALSLMILRPLVRVPRDLIRVSNATSYRGHVHFSQ